MRNGLLFRTKIVLNGKNPFIFLNPADLLQRKQVLLCKMVELLPQKGLTIY